VPLEYVLAKTEKAAVCLTRIAAYPTGFSFDIATLTDPEHDDLDPLLFDQPRRRRTGVEIPPELLRFGLQFSDGSKVTNLGGPSFGRHDPQGPTMFGRGGGGGGGAWHQSHWIWPLPPPGPMLVVCEWPAADIAQTQTEIDAQLVLDAAARAQVIFSEGDP
jgi:hypothetical protein